ncbi:hypothetical protein [Nocardia fluminea]|uniref:hypothetical protein n=1 Tax=Nocardia fluminea TaxID=134984 RepID=UPI00364E1726
MFRRSSTPRTPDTHDELVVGALPDRVQTARERLAHQYDPALLEALSEPELAEERELAEMVREHRRDEQRARIRAAADAASRVRETAKALADREAADLLRAAQAVGEQRHSSSPHAKVARLHYRKPRVLALLVAVVAGSMLFSAVTVQQNIAPGVDVTDPMFWLSYGLEALISAVLVALMLSTTDTSEWNVLTEGKLRQVYLVEASLLLASIVLNTFPYIRDGDVYGFGVHVVAPVMIGVALITHRLVAERYGRAIEAATAAIPDHEDLQARLVALTRVGDAGNLIVPAILTPADLAEETDSPVEDAVIAEYEAELRETDEQDKPARATEDTADRAHPIARDTADRAPIAREEADRARTDSEESIARDPETARDSEPVARAVKVIEAEPIARGAQPDAALDRAPIAVEPAPIARAESAPIAAHTPIELGTDRVSIAAHTADTAPAARVEVEEHADEAESARADSEEPIARDPEPVDRAQRAPIALVSIARDEVDRARPRTDRAREASTTGALAHASEPAPIARGVVSRAGEHGPFGREISRAEAEKFARAVTDRGLVKQPVNVLTEIFVLASQGARPNAIGKSVGLAHSTVGRALERVTQVVGPRPV